MFPLFQAKHVMERSNVSYFKRSKIVLRVRFLIYMCVCVCVYINVHAVTQYSPHKPCYHAKLVRTGYLTLNAAHDRGRNLLLVVSQLHS